jgi:hypothetical protein
MNDEFHFHVYGFVNVGQDGIVGVTTHYGLDGLGIESQ